MTGDAEPKLNRSKELAAIDAELEEAMSELADKDSRVGELLNALDQAEETSPEDAAGETDEDVPQ